MAVEFLAPAYISVEEGQILRSIGVTSQLPCDLPAGISLRWPLIRECEIEGPKTAHSWYREIFTLVPDGALEPSVQTAILYLHRENKVQHVLPSGHSLADPTWEKVTVAHFPAGWQETYGKFYSDPANSAKAELYPVEFRVRVIFKHVPVAVPPTWEPLVQEG